MTLLMRNQANVEKGEELLAKLIILLSEDGRLSDIIRVSQDKEYRQELYVEYHIIWEQEHDRADHLQAFCLV